MEYVIYRIMCFLECLILVIFAFGVFSIPIWIYLAVKTDWAIVVMILTYGAIIISYISNYSRYLHKKYDKPQTKNDYDTRRDERS